MYICGGAEVCALPSALLVSTVTHKGNAVERESEQFNSFKRTDHKRESNFLGSEQRKKGTFTAAHSNTKENTRPNLNEANCSEQRKYENSSLNFVTEQIASKTCKV